MVGIWKSCYEYHLFMQATISQIKHVNKGSWKKYKNEIKCQDNNNDKGITEQDIR